MQLVFASANKHKIAELASLINPGITLIGLSEIGCLEEIPETSATIEGNALQKALYVYNQYKLNCFADDTGLEVEALDGRPGVFSARYAGNDRNAEKNMQKILKELDGNTNRNACFRTVIALVLDGKQAAFEGLVRGEILTEKQGKQGFGYDPIFRPLGFTKSYAEMSLEEKNKFSHRAIAVHKLVEYLKGLISS